MNKTVRLAQAALIVAVLLVPIRQAQATVCVPGAPPPQKPLHDPPPPPCEPKTCNSCTKSPCYLAGGTYIDDFLDLQIPTAGMYPLTISRRYDSSRPADGPLGVGWSSSLTAHLYYAVYLVSAPSTYSYEADVIMPSGALYRFAANGNAFTPPAGSFDSLVKNSDGTYSFTLQHSRSVYKFNADGSIASLTDDYGNGITYSYDAAGRVQQVADSAGSGRNLQITWGASGRIQSIKDNANRVISYEYANDGTLISYSDPIASADPSLRTTRYSYVAGRFGPLLSRIEDRWHRTISNISWYSDGRMQSYTEGDYNDNNPTSSPGEKYTYTYGSDGVSATKSDSLGSTTYTWSTAGVANDAFRTFDPTTGLVLSETTPSGAAFNYTYNARGNIATVSLGSTTWTHTYDSTYPDALAAITPSQPSQWPGWKYYYYNGINGAAAGALLRVDRIGTDGVTATPVASYTYDSQGHLTSASDSTGHVHIYGYNGAGDVISVQTAGNTTLLEYDAVGRVTKVTTPSGNATSFAYDDDDRVTTITPPGGTSLFDPTSHTAYDVFDQTTGTSNTVVTTPNGATLTRGYDALGHLVRSVDALGNVSAHAYQYNLLHSITDANGNTTSYSYNSNRYLTKTTFWDGAFETYTVNAFGGLTSLTDRRGQTSTWLHDAFGRLTAGPEGTYTYAGQNLVSAPGVSYTYDSQFHVASETQAGGDILSYTYGYATDVLASYRIDPPQGQPGNSFTATLGYDSAGRLSSMQWSAVAGSFTFSYNADGQYSAITFPNGQSRTFAYDPQGRLTSLANLDTQSHNLLTFAYGYDYDWQSRTYDAIGLKTSMTTTGSAAQYPNGQTTYGYDANEELTSAARAGGTNATYAYDSIGNRTQSVVGGATTPFVYYQNGSGKNSPRLRSALGSDLQYDANGNLLTGGYVWDADNRLTAISGLHFQYDYANRRNLYTPPPGGSAVRYVSWGDNLIAERSADTAHSNDYLFGPGIDEPLARRSSDGSIRYYLADGLGSIVGWTSTSGQVSSTSPYDEWGNGSATDLFGYTGREPAPGQYLWYYRARYYRSDWGRFISEDPRRNPVFSSYQYVGNMPTMYIDPSGAVAYNVSTPQYHGQIWDDVVASCDGKYAYGCTKMKGHVDCDCAAVCDLHSHQTVYKPNISLTAQINVYYATDIKTIPGALIKSEEEKHVQSLLSTLSGVRNSALELESETFGSLIKCKFSCFMFKTLTVLKLDVTMPLDHLSHPHP